MFFDTTSHCFCEDCARGLNAKYNNFKRAKLRLSNKDFTNFRDETTIKSMDEAWISIVNPPSNVQTEENCLFMLNFNKRGDTMVTSCVNIIDIWDFKTKEKKKSLTDHVEIVTGLEWLKAPQEDVFISCSLDKTMKIWRNYNCVQTLNHHKDWLRCMSVSSDNQYLVSGCVSSVVWGYDLHKQQPTFTIVNKDGKASLNTINSIDFKHDAPIFLSGTRDGFIKLYDIRTDVNKPIQEIFSHKMKLNSAVFGQNNNYMLSAGRDSAARLWDLRMTKDIENSKTSATNANLPVRGFIAEYKGHASHGYNIPSHFFINDKYVITGSEDGFIYIYNTQTAKMVRKISAGTKIIHLLKPYPNPEVGFAYSGLQRSTIHFYDAKTVEDLKPQKEVKNKVEQIGNDFNEPSVKFIEDFMAENGDLILKVFHSNNITYSSGMSWENLLKVIMRQADDDSRKLYRKLNEILFRNIHQFLQNPQGFMNNSTNAPTEVQEKPRKAIYRNIKEISQNCQRCKEREGIRPWERESLDTNCEILKDLP